MANVFEDVSIDNIALISDTDISKADLLLSLFCEHMYIYVNDSNGKLYGIITMGDFIGHLDENEYINTNFIYITEGRHTNQNIDKILKNKNLKEIPVLSLDRKLCYVKRKKRDIANCFDFDWSLCDESLVKKFFEKYEHICYFHESKKISDMKGFTVLPVQMKKIESIREYNYGDLLVIQNKYLGKDMEVKAYNVDEIFLMILAETTVRELIAHGVDYFFFQIPEYDKCRRENQVYYPKEINVLAEDTVELKKIFGDYDNAIRYWTERDYRKVKLCETKEGRFLPENAHSYTYNVQDNQRVTLNQPKKYRHTIYILGTCFARGYGVSDDLTIPSLLQMKLNEEGFSEYRVVNLGTGGGLNTYADIRDFVNIRKTDVRQNDIVIHLGYNC